MLTRSSIVAIILACFQNRFREKKVFSGFCNVIENQTENEHLTIYMIELIISSPRNLYVTINNIKHEKISE